MSKLQPVRGTRDIVGEEARRMKAVTDTFERVASLYGFDPITTPIFEFTEVFARPLGESSDIVSKEMYSFEDRGGESLTLRPEFTAGIARAFISGGMQQLSPVRLMCHGPAFRYERPQKGRYRQFHQINAEIIGSDEPATDVETIAMAARLLGELGLSDRVVLKINTLGDAESRQRYRAALVGFLQQHSASLSDDSQRRLAQNPLRILDSKDRGDQQILQSAPDIADYLSDQADAFFKAVQDGLAASGVAFERDARLVRGMDYYTHTAFEFVTTDLGAQGTVIGGGRYDGLVEKLGGPPAPGIGWAGGIERLAMLMDGAPSLAQPVFVLPMGEAAATAAFRVAEALRGAGVAVFVDRRGGLGKRLQRADKKGASHAVIIGDDELAAASAQVKTLASGGQDAVAFDRLAAFIAGGRP